MSLRIIRAKPNPSGKDYQKITSAIQLAGEWVDIQNIDDRSISLDGVVLFHLAYTANGKSEWESAMEFSGVIHSGEVIRVHSGKSLPVSQMTYQDRFGANYHFFTDKNYIWNNDKPDKPSLWYKPKRQWIDQAEYNACPMEGKILKRVQEKLI